MIPAQNLIQLPDELATSPGLRLFSEKSLAPDLPPLRIMNYAFGLTLGGTATETIGLQTCDIRSYAVVFAPLLVFSQKLFIVYLTNNVFSFTYCSISPANAYFIYLK